MGGEAIEESVAAFDSHGNIYVGSDNGYVYSISPSGSIRWNHSCGGYEPHVVVGSDDTVYVVSGNKVCAYTNTGNILWTYTLNKNAYSDPAIGPDGTIYIADYYHTLYAIKSGSLLWSYSIGSVYSSPVIDSDGTIYVASDLGYMAALNPDGSKKWTLTFVQDSTFSMASLLIGNNDTIYAALGSSTGSYIYAINKDGTIKWGKSYNLRIRSQLLMSDSGILYTVMEDSTGLDYIYAIESDSAAIANTPWPRYRHDNSNTGRATSLQPTHSFSIRSLKASPSTGQVPLQVTFTCDVYDPTGTIDVYEWDFDGDGIVDITTDQPTVSYTYTSPGTYTVKLTVRDDSGNSATKTITVTVTQSEVPFSDISSSWAEKYIIEIYNAGITQGYPDGTYRPEEPVTRAQMATFIARALHLPINNSCSSSPFVDVPTYQWYCPYVEAIKNTGITQGYPDGTYKPDRLVTRAEMAAFLARSFIGGSSEPGQSEAVINNPDQAESAFSTGLYSGWLMYYTFMWVNQMVNPFIDAATVLRSIRSPNPFVPRSYDDAIKSAFSQPFMRRSLLSLLPKRATEPYSGEYTCENGGSYSYTGTRDIEKNYHDLTFTFSQCRFGNGYELNGSTTIKGTYNDSNGDFTVTTQTLTLSYYDSDEKKYSLSMNNMQAKVTIDYDISNDKLNTMFDLNGTITGTSSENLTASVSYSNTRLLMELENLTSDSDSTNLYMTVDGKVDQSLSTSYGNIKASVNYTNFKWSLVRYTLAIDGTMEIAFSPGGLCSVNNGTYKFVTKTPIFDIPGSYSGDILINDNTEIVWNSDNTVSIFVNGSEVARESGDDFISDKACIAIWQ